MFEDLAAIAEANARGRRLLGAVSCCPLSMDFTLQLALRVRRPGVVAARVAAEGRGLSRASSPSRAFRDGDARGDRAARRTFACSTASGTRSQVVESRGTEFEQRSIAALAQRGGQGSARLHARPRARREPRHGVQRAAPQLRRGGGRPHAARPVERWSRSPTPARTSRSSTTRATACTCSATGSRELGVLTLAEAARRLTGQPAAVFGIRERGALEAGLPRRPAALRSGEGRRAGRSGACSTCPAASRA